jgi:hypothetical protein
MVHTGAWIARGCNREINELGHAGRAIGPPGLASPLQTLLAAGRTLLHLYRGSFMNRLMTSLAVLATASLAQGCATSQPTQRAAAPVAQTNSAATGFGVKSDSSCAGPKCAAEVLRVAHRTEVTPEKDAPAVPGHPLTSVVVTQCNLIVAVYLTMPDGSLLRFDSSASVPADKLLEMAYTATRSERVEVSCNDNGAVGYEKHDPV